MVLTDMLCQKVPTTLEDTFSNIDNNIVNLIWFKIVYTSQ